MVVVRVQCRGLDVVCGIDREAIGAGINAHAELVQFGFECGDAVGFMEAENGHVVYADWRRRKRGDRAQGWHDVGCGVHVDVETRQASRSAHFNAFGVFADVTAHFGEDIDKADVALNGLRR